MLETARHATANQLERIVTAYARAIPNDDRAQLAARRFDVVHHEDGTATIAIRRCSPDTAATIVAAAEAALDEVPTDLGDTYAARLVDALETVARAFVAPDDTKPREVVAHLDIEHPSTATTATTSEPGSAEPGSSWSALVDGLAVSVDTARELLCDASVVVAVTGDDGVTRFVRRHKPIPAATRSRVERRDRRQCRWPGCTNHAWLHAHHIQWRSRRTAARAPPPAARRPRHPACCRSPPRTAALRADGPPLGHRHAGRAPPPDELSASE